MRVKFIDTTMNNEIIIETDDFSAIIPGKHDNGQPILRFYQESSDESCWEVFGTTADIEPPPEVLESRYYKERKKSLDLKVLPKEDEDFEEDYDDEDEEEVEVEVEGEEEVDDDDNQ